ncbi:hypothetical protein LJC40_02895 [Synergistaceae bacterium OttesenSCG-928-D05]|nr:hypothetical protein [Synergistaceae bacterium OttesenSCG-928-D05]
MKKTLAAIFVALLIICFFFSFIADAFADELPAGERSMNLWFDTLNTAKHPVTIKYSTKIDLGMGEETTEVTLFVKDSETRRVDLAAKSHHLSILTVGAEMCVMMHDEAIFVRREIGAGKKLQLGPPVDLPSTPDSAACLISCGTEEIKGKPHYYEEMDFGDKGPRTFYYDPLTYEWRYWKTGDEMLEIFAYGNEISDRTFVVPAWYKEIKDI